MSITVLAPGVVSKIAAGEVVERPASVVKELVENALDAMATRIVVEVDGGGVQVIKVTDNGVGIPPHEVELAFERHATGKITSESDLETVTTLGFRGEALPSIAAVADVLMISRHRDEPAGVALRLEGGRLLGKSPQGSAEGTSVSVRHLFQNVPARLKFLKSVATENSRISQFVTQYALAFPQVKFELMIGGRTILRTPGTGRLEDALIEVYGLQTAKAMLPIEVVMETTGEEGLPAISGFISPSSVARANRNYLSFFVNHRWIQSRMLTYAVEEAYQGMLMTGKHPISVINIDIPPTEIDVNVHPSKSEIKFRRERDVFLTVQKAVRGTLVGCTPVSSMRISASAPMASSLQSPSSMERPGELEMPSPVSGGKSKQALQHTLPGLPILRLIGQLHNAYIVAEGEDGVYLVDQHAAHERVMFEKVLAQLVSHKPEVQGLLEPMTIEVTAHQAELLTEHAEILSDSGFLLELFGERTYLLRAVPALLKGEVVHAVLNEILDSLGSLHNGERRQAVASSLACHGAVRAGKMLTVREMEALLRQLEETQSPRTCPHGRPTMLHISAAQLEKEFGRK